MILERKAGVAVTVFLLMTGLIFTNITGIAYADDVSNEEPCGCELVSVTIEHNGESYTTEDTTYYFDGNLQTFDITSYFAEINTGENHRGASHEIFTFYSFDQSVWVPIENLENYQIPIESENDLYLKFVLDNDDNSIQAKYLHFTRSVFVSNITVDSSELPSTGGKVNVTVQGAALPSDLEVRVYDVNDIDLGITADSKTVKGEKAAMAVNDTIGTFTVSLPENTLEEDQIYVIKAAVNGDPLEASATVTVVGASSDVEDDCEKGECEEYYNGGKTGDDSFISHLIAALASIFALCLILMMKKVSGRIWYRN